MGPATPKQARSTGRLWADRNWLTIWSRPANSPLGNVSSTRDCKRPSPSIWNNASLVWVPPMSPARITLRFSSIVARHAPSTRLLPWAPRCQQHSLEKLWVVVLSKHLKLAPRRSNLPRPCRHVEKEWHRRTYNRKATVHSPCSECYQSSPRNGSPYLPPQCEPGDRVPWRQNLTRYLHQAEYGEPAGSLSGARWASCGRE